MKFKMELLILPIVLLFIYFRPTFLVNFSSTFLGKLLMLILLILATLKNKWYGVSVAVLIIIITELGVIEGYDDRNNMGDDMGDDMVDNIDDDMGDDMEQDMEQDMVDDIGDDMGDDMGDGMGDDMGDDTITGLDETVGADTGDAVTGDAVTSDAVTSDAETGADGAFTLMNFGVTGGNERLYIDEKLRPKNSNECLR